MGMTNTAAAAEIDRIHRALTDGRLVLVRDADCQRAYDLLGELVAASAQACGVDPSRIAAEPAAVGGNWTVAFPSDRETGRRGGLLLLSVVDVDGDDQDVPAWVRIQISHDDTTWLPGGRMQCAPINLPLWLGLALTAAEADQANIPQ